MTRFIALVLAGLLFCSTVTAQPIKVGVHNFVRAETDRYMNNLIAQGELGKLRHRREPVDLQKQTIIRMNLDTLYSNGVFDMTSGAVTVTLPETTDGRYISAHVISQDHFTIDIYHSGTNTFTMEDVDTRYAVLVVRVFADAFDADDIALANRLQDKVIVSQRAAGEFIVPSYDGKSFDATRRALLQLGSLSRGHLGAFFGGVGEVDPVSHLVATAVGWGGLPRTEAGYFSAGPLPGDADKPHELILSDVPTNAFWSITLYDQRGFMIPNGSPSVNALNNVNAIPKDDGSYRIQLGGCKAKIPNCIPTPEGWNYVFRAYQPSESILSGEWQPPKATPIKMPIE